MRHGILAIKVSDERRQVYPLRHGNEIPRRILHDGRVILSSAWFGYDAIDRAIDRMRASREAAHLRVWAPILWDEGEAIIREIERLRPLPNIRSEERRVGKEGRSR